MHGIIVIINIMAIIVLFMSIVLVSNAFTGSPESHRHANIAGSPKTSISCKSCVILSDVLESNGVLTSILYKIADITNPEIDKNDSSNS